MTGLLKESKANGQLFIHLWMKSRFAGKISVRASDIVHKERVEKPKQGADDVADKDSADQVEIYYITMKDERVITGVAGDTVGGKVVIEVGSKGALWEVFTVKAADIIDMQRVPQEEVSVKEIPDIEDLEEKVERRDARREEICSELYEAAQKELNKVQRKDRISGYDTLGSQMQGYMDRKKIHWTVAKNI